MRLLKRLCFMCMIFGLIVSLSACSSSNTSNVSIPDTKDIQKIQDRGVLRVGVKKSVPGFGEKKNGKYTGMEVDLAKKLAQDLNVKVQYTSVTPSSRETLLNNGKVDCILATYTITNERKEKFDFSPSYYTAKVSVLVDDDNIHSLSDLQGRVIGVVNNSESASDLVQAMIDKNIISSDGYDKNSFDASTWTNGVTFHVYDDYTQLNQALEAGDIDGFCTDTSILKGYEKNNRHLIDESFASQHYGVATKKNSGMSTFVKREIKKWKKDGSIDALKKSYGI